MYKKISLALTLVAVLSVQLATSLECFTCVNPNDCNTATVVTCDNTNTEATMTVLRAHLQNVPVTPVNPQFRCILNRFANINNAGESVTAVEIAGCAFNVNTCNLNLQATFGTPTQVLCTDCNEDQCNNPRNPAGTYSSSFFTIMGSALLLMSAKFLA